MASPTPTPIAAASRAQEQRLEAGRGEANAVPGEAVPRRATLSDCRRRPATAIIKPNPHSSAAPPSALNRDAAARPGCSRPPRRAVSPKGRAIHGRSAADVRTRPTPRRSRLSWPGRGGGSQKLGGLYPVRLRLESSSQDRRRSTG